VERKTLAYALIRYVPDVTREEFVNIGVIVVSDADRESAVRVLPGYRLRGRLRLLSGRADPAVVLRLLTELSRRARASYGPRFDQSDEAALTSSEQLQSLKMAMPNQIQLSDLKAYRAAGVQMAADELMVRLVIPRSAEKPVPAAHMTLAELRERIQDVVTRWQGQGVVVDDASLRSAEGGGHYADVWVEADTPLRQGRQVLAAFFAFPEEPGSRSEVFLRRDAVPTLTSAFQKENPHFRTVAVFPPNGHEPSPFIRETIAMLRGISGVVVTHLDRLDAMKADVLSHAGREKPQRPIDGVFGE
jgi:hypothetical protein